MKNVLVEGLEEKFAGILIYGNYKDPPQAEDEHTGLRPHPLAFVNFMLLHGHSCGLATNLQKLDLNQLGADFALCSQ